MRKISLPQHLPIGLVALFTAQQIRSAVALDPWQTMDSYQAVAPVPGANPSDIGADASRTMVYTVGSAIVMDGTHWATVRASNDSGTNWNNLDMFLQPGFTSTHYAGCSTAPNGDLFVSGMAASVLTGPDGWQWIVRRSQDLGTTWTTVDAPAFVAGYRPSARDIKIAPSGEVYAAGLQAGGSSPSEWIVRKSSQHGDPDSWTAIDVIASLGASEARYVGFNASGTVLVVGHVGNSQNGSGVWTVRRPDVNGIWKTVDAYQESSGLAASAESIATSSTGAIYVAGYARGFTSANGKSTKGTYHDYWVVRRSTDGGSTWTSIDKTTSADSSFLSPTGMITDAAGAVWVCGYTGPSATPNQWLVRKGTSAANGTLSWTDSDVFKLGIGAAAHGLAIDGAHHIFATGIWIDATGANWWLTRKF